METVKLKKTKQNSYMLSYNGEEYMYFDFADLIEGVITHVGLQYEETAQGPDKGHCRWQYRATAMRQDYRDGKDSGVEKEHH